MRSIVSSILVMICPFILYAENNVSRAVLIENVYKKAYQYIKANNPQYEYYISYYFEEFEIGLFSTKYSGKLEKDLFSEYAEIILSDDYPRSPEYSESLFKIFETENKKNLNPQYEIWFGFPTDQNFITCTVYKYGDRKDNMTGSTYTLYFFAFDEYNDIYMMDNFDFYVLSDGYF